MANLTDEQKAEVMRREIETLRAKMEVEPWRR